MFLNKEQSSTISFILFTTLKTIHFLPHNRLIFSQLSKNILVNKSPGKVKVLNTWNVPTCEYVSGGEEYFLLYFFSDHIYLCKIGSFEHLTLSGLQNRLQMAIIADYMMSKIETTSKVSLKLPSRINLGRRDKTRTRWALDFGHSP